MEKVRIGIVGLGWVSQVVHLPILTRLPEADIVAVCDRDRSRAKLVAEKFGIRRSYTDLDQMLANEGLSAAIIATSTDAHRDATLAVLKAGCDVLVEKPIARHYTEAVEMADSARVSKKKLMVGMNHRFRPDTMLLRSLIEAKELGKLFYVRVGWLRKRRTDSTWAMQKEKSGGGVFVDLGIMMLDLAFWLLGYPEVRRVTAVNFYLKTKQVEDTTIATITLNNEAVINIEVSWSTIVEDDMYYCDVYGSDGSARMHPLRVFKEVRGNLVNIAPAKSEPVGHLFKRSYENELRHFLGAVRDLHPVISTAEEAVHRMRIVDAVYRSARTGKEVVLP
jgi:predicted dehydrogenase